MSIVTPTRKYRSNKTQHELSLAEESQKKSDVLRDKIPSIKLMHDNFLIISKLWDLNHINKYIKLRCIILFKNKLCSVEQEINAIKNWDEESYLINLCTPDEIKKNLASKCSSNLAFMKEVVFKQIKHSGAKLKSQLVIITFSTEKEHDAIKTCNVKMRTDLTFMKIH